MFTFVNGAALLPRRSREPRLALYAKLKEDAVAEFHARQQQYRDWIAVAEIEERMRERRGDFDRKGPIPDTLRSILRNAARGDYGDRSLFLWVDQNRSNFGRRWLIRPEAAPASAFLTKDLRSRWQFHGEDIANAYLISHAWVLRAIAVEWLRADGIEPPPNWNATSAEVREAIEAVRTGTAGRPTSKHLALTEMTARHSRGELAPTLAAEAHALVEWLKKECQGSPVPTAHSLENSIRREYHKLKST